jgi:fumarate hydratase class II
MRYRAEKDAIGEVKVPSDAYYGSETVRSLENFNISGISIQSEFIRSYAIIKISAALANHSIGKLDNKRKDAIVAACDEILRGSLSDQFFLDIFQAGAGTSTNMNVNEVIANRAIEIIGGKKGDYSIMHPNDHVNMSQSTNDTYHTAIHISSYISAKENLLPAILHLSNAFQSKSREFEDVIKVGRTHLQDAVPIRLSDEFSGYAGILRKAHDNISNAIKLFLELPLGGTAVGSGINAGKGYSTKAIHEINRMLGDKFYPSKNIYAVMQNQHEEIVVSDALAELATLLGKIANDLRFLSSGPRAGICELILPEVQPGSSIMPGKINPSMAEMMNMVCFQAIGNATTVREAGSAGQLELNVFMPIISYNLLFSINILSKGMHSFADRCIAGIKINKAMIKKHLDNDLSMATALVPYIGYEKAAEIARKAYLENKSIFEIALGMHVMDGKKLKHVLDPERFI